MPKRRLHVRVTDRQYQHVKRVARDQRLPMKDVVWDMIERELVAVEQDPVAAGERTRPIDTSPTSIRDGENRRE